MGLQTPSSVFSSISAFQLSPSSSSPPPKRFSVQAKTVKPAPNSNSNSNFSVTSQKTIRTIWDIEALSWGRTAATALCDTVESFTAEFIDPKKYPPSQDPKIQLAGNFAPVTESPPLECQILGVIPSCLRGGAYIRNGSNPLHPPVAGYHYFDGHGMLHSVRFSDKPDGLPIYCARFTKTSRFLQEQAAGKPLFPNSLGEMSSFAGLARVGLFGLRVALGLINVFDGYGSSNAGMGYFNGRLMAMSEEDFPYVVRLTKDGDLETTGRYSFGNQLQFPMCAHPKIDLSTGQLFAFSFNPIVNPHLRYFWATPSGQKSPDFEVNLDDPCFFHDFAITENYAVLPETQLVMKVDNLFRNKSPIVGDPTKRTRFGVIPRVPAAGSRVRWFEVPDWTSFHYLNAWEEGKDKIVILSSCISPVDGLFDHIDQLVNRVYEVHLDLRTGESYRQHVCSAGLDFGQINQRYLGRKNRYVYLCHYGPWPKFAGITKVDLEAPRLPRVAIEGPKDPDLNEPCIVGRRIFEPGTYCSEPYFVEAEDGGGDEDDGYVICHVHNEKIGASELLIMDAKSPTLESVAVVKLPVRVPYGFHGLFVNAEQLSNQSGDSLSKSLKT